MARPLRKAVTQSRKEKKTFTLSRAAVNFLEDETRKRGVASVSLVLEDLIQERRKRSSTKSIDAAISSYYDSLSDKELEEDKRWGEFAESQLPHD